MVPQFGLGIVEDHCATVGFQPLKEIACEDIAFACDNSKVSTMA